MKGWSEGVLLGLLVLQSAVLHVRCVEPVHCQWGAYGDWSECDGCSKTQSRTRHAVTYAQFGGVECSGPRTQTQSCSPTSGCPLEEGCGERFQCSSGQCISRALVCNGDQDCEEDALDEQGCRGSLCDIHKVPANTELTGKGMDVTTGESRGAVINTKAFGGQCRKVFSGDSRDFYRLPQSLVGFTFQVKIENDFSNELYDSSWSYEKHEEQRKKSNEGHHYKTFHKELSKKETHQLMIIKNEVEVGQFQNAPAAYLPLSEEFWKGLLALPTVYDYAAYLGLIKRYGTHFLSEGTLGGKYQVMLGIDAKSESEMRTSSSRTPVYPSIHGGDPAYIAGLSVINLQDPASNMNMYSKWAGSVKNFPTIIKPKLRSLHELVKEVPCAAVKRLHLRRAIEEYQTEEHPCRCKPCQNNGLPVLSGTTCSCVCKKETSGPACEYGTVMDEQPGVIHGEWTCWSGWSSCGQGQRSRTRSCSNPYPSGGGKHCNGEAEERKSCEDEDLQHLRLMEPHCFDPSLSAPRHCQTPPPLVNGIVLEPKDMYLVGSRVSYACVQGFHLVGADTAECMEDLSWKRSRMECKSTVCMVPPLPRDVVGSPWSLTYQIGETIALSCPPGWALEGVSEIQCDSSLNWSPNPDSIKCNLLSTISPLKAVGCKQWEKEEKGRCVCKLPYECSLSLDVCARSEEKGRSLRLSLCKMQALVCLGQRYVLTKNSACQWPSRDTAACSTCQPGETCDGETGRCRCKEPAECTYPGAQLCVQYGETAATITMSECETGLRRCKGESLSVISITACQE